MDAAKNNPGLNTQTVQSQVIHRQLSSQVLLGISRTPSSDSTHCATAQTWPTRLEGKGSGLKGHPLTQPKPVFSDPGPACLPTAVLSHIQPNYPTPLSCHSTGLGRGCSISETAMGNSKASGLFFIRDQYQALHPHPQLRSLKELQC
ncbi:hypothetical protein AGOR_G00073360 [Albula goreensis]|uniref:Uncharacterized protein n=1 Tax=Albula goreensis TaxID=1534307 RepID=A0A8T3DW85_9TELE|nr:hypothetical protein AGOR_G00073360 [Albula goreensis]